MANSRSRSRLGSRARGGAVEGEHPHPGGQLAAIATSSHQIWFWVNRAGQVAQPGVLGRADLVLTPAPAASDLRVADETACSACYAGAGASR